MTHERTHQHFLELIHRHQSIIHKICFVLLQRTEPTGKISSRKLSCSYGNLSLLSWKHAAFSTWMYRVALNTAINQTRKPGLLT